MDRESSNPLAFLPAADYRSYQLSCYVFTSCLTTYAYDWLLSIAEECEIVARSGLTPSNALYFVSRIAAFTTLLLNAIYATTEPSNLLVAPIDDCQALVGVLGASTVLMTMATATLFFLRVRAVYLRSRVITAVFGALWLITLGITLLQVSALNSVHIASTKKCAPTKNEYLQLPCIVTTVSDTLVFLAITYRLAADAVIEDTFYGWVRTILHGRGLYSLSKALMQSGQRYYLASIVFFMANLAVMCAPGVPSASRFVFAPFYSGFTNMMAARVFRGVALGLLEGTPGLTTTRIAAALQLNEAVELKPLDDTQTGSTLA
ncbi:hypothetical protein HWV62_5411 [Athelia sp. TMB]|nr:hypothetical protein HWV62_5411 [Athelia sp. TMB]